MNKIAESLAAIVGETENLSKAEALTIARDLARIAAELSALAEQIERASEPPREKARPKPLTGKQARLKYLRMGCYRGQL